jgi:hypothetical protein
LTRFLYLALFPELLFLISPDFSLLHKLLKVIDADTKNVPKTVCGQRHPATLHFHHLNSEDKVFNISDATRHGISLDRIKKEINKCMVLCANCHAIRHYNMRNKKQTSPGIAGEFEELNTLLAVSPEEEDAYNMQFGESGDVE